MTWGLGRHTHIHNKMEGDTDMPSPMRWHRITTCFMKGMVLLSGLNSKRKAERNLHPSHSYLPVMRWHTGMAAFWVRSKKKGVESGSQVIPYGSFVYIQARGGKSIYSSHPIIPTWTWGKDRGITVMTRLGWIMRPHRIWPSALKKKKSFLFSLGLTSCHTSPFSHT